MKNFSIKARNFVLIKVSRYVDFTLTIEPVELDTEDETTDTMTLKEATRLAIELNSFGQRVSNYEIIRPQYHIMRLSDWEYTQTPKFYEREFNIDARDYEDGEDSWEAETDRNTSMMEYIETHEIPVNENRSNQEPVEQVQLAYS